MRLFDGDSVRINAHRETRFGAANRPMRLRARGLATRCAIGCAMAPTDVRTIRAPRRPDPRIAGEPGRAIDAIFGRETNKGGRVFRRDLRKHSLVHDPADGVEAHADVLGVEPEFAMDRLVLDPSGGRQGRL